MRLRLQEVIHIRPLLACIVIVWSWRLLGVAVMTSEHFVFVLKSLVEVLTVRRSSLHEVIWILSISSVNIVCCIASILHEVGLIASCDGVVAHSGHGCCHVFVSASLFAVKRLLASALILHASVLREAIVFLLARAKVIWDQCNFVCCGRLWLELWVVLHAVDADKVRAVAAAVPNWIGVACHLLHDAPVVAHTDGITLCKRLRSDSRLDGIENVISSTNMWLVVGVRRNLLLRN